MPRAGAAAVVAFVRSYIFRLGFLDGAMGFAASFALGLALSLPQVPVWLINADGSLCMNLGCLLTEASQAASNLKHFVVANGVYEIVASLTTEGATA
jgi:thiamine pyrophosphate-dependent acetolactate synthase large subunit-like protein